MILGGRTRRCRWCGSAFTETKYRRIYCSYRCEHEAKYKHQWQEGDPLPGKLPEPETRICRTCGKPFPAGNEGKFFCSDKCRFHRDAVLKEMEKERQR